MFRSRLWSVATILIAVGICGLLGAFALNLPFVQDRIGWRISELRAAIKYALSPPENVVFTPNPTVVAMVKATLDAYSPTVTTTPTSTHTPDPTSQPTITPTQTITPTPIPEEVRLDGVVHEYQRYNNCGPANLSMALSFWGWKGNQYITAAYLKPSQDDRNVMPYEMIAFIQEETDFSVLVRVGGDIDLLKRFIASGFPPLVEKGFEGPSFNGWMGHYEVLTGYDDAKEQFIAQDSYINPDIAVPYEFLKTYWRQFNNTYLVIYPSEDEEQIMAILGPHADETYSIELAAQKASDEIFTTSGRAQFFAWFNRGTNLRLLQDYQGAAAAYDEAFRIYAEIDPETIERPWRMLWYQTGPYWAYYYTGRYYDVINLADTTLNTMSDPVLEESFYWRALAREALGDITGAIEDFRTAAEVHPDWEVALVQLQRLGATP